MLIQYWFKLIQTIKEKYNIANKDIWNFNKSGFFISKIMLQLIITGLKKPGKTKKLQPNNYKQVTLV